MQRAEQKCNDVKSATILTWAGLDPNSHSLVRVCVSSLFLSHRCKDSRGECPLILLTNRKARLKFLLTLPVFHLFTCTHSHTVSSRSAASQQQVSEDRGHLCAELPLFSSSASGHLCWRKTGREEWDDSLPLCSYVHTTKTQNSFNQNASALASWTLPLSFSLYFAPFLCL